MSLENIGSWETENPDKYERCSNKIIWHRMNRSLERKVYKDFGDSYIDDFEISFSFKINEIKSSTTAQRNLINLIVFRKDLSDYENQLCLYAAQNRLEEKNFLLTFFQRVNGSNLKPVGYSDYLFSIEQKYFVKIIKNNKQCRLYIYADENYKKLLYDSGLIFWDDEKYRYMIICNGINIEVDKQDYSSGELSNLIISKKYYIKAYISTSHNSEKLKNVLKDSLLEVGIEPLYQDIIKGHSYVDEIHNNIKNANIIIAILNESNANVYYEIGYASALRKIVLPILSSWDFAMPSYLRNNLYLVYDKDHLDEFKPLFKNWIIRMKSDIMSGMKINE